MSDDLLLNVPLLRRRVPNLTVAARSVGLRPATVSDLCTGKIPVSRAEVRTLAALASLANCSLDELVIRAARASFIETGIKLVDVFAPLMRGGTVGLVARTGLGQIVVLAELMRRLREQRGFAVVLWLPPELGPHMRDATTEAEVVCRTWQDVRDTILAARAERDVVLAADRQVVLTGELLDLREALREPGSRPVTTALIDARGEAPDEHAPFGPLEALWRFDVDLAARGVYPAIDPVASASTLLEGAQVEAEHLATQARARKLLRRYRELRALVAARGPERLAEEAVAYRRGERLEAWLTQPFFVAEGHTKRPGEWVPLHDTLAGIRRLLDGQADEAEVGSLRMRGHLPDDLPARP